jgi:kumamolisin
MSVESIQVDLPPSLSPEQIKILPLANSISEGNLLTATKIATAYNIPPGNGAGVKVGIISLGGGFSQTDLNKSMANLGLTTGNVTFVGVNGATNDYTGNVDLDGENTLDLVCVAGMVPSANIVLYKANGSQGFNNYYSNASTATIQNSNTSFGNAIQRAVDDNCDAISISWGGSEKLISGNVTYYCGDYLSGPLANAAAKNISVFVAAGDYGSRATDPYVITDPAFNIVSTDYPSVNANVTAVGGTYLTLGAGNTWVSETVYNNSVAGYPTGFGGGGGVSSMVSLPSYQANLTYKTYPDNVVHSLNSRGIPDISAAMNAYGVWLGNSVYGFAGTSASAPIMAGTVARFISLNGGRRPPGGSAGLNSIFYNHTGGFRDITTGNNASYLPNGYASTTSWDATTGLGPQSNATATYQAVTSAGVAIKNSANTWAPIANAYVKTGASTWATVQHIWTKTAANTWTQTY